MQNNITLLLIGENTGDILAFKSKLNLLREVDNMKDIEYDGSFNVIKKHFPGCVFIFGDEKHKDACELCRKIKKDPLLTNIPLIFITKNQDEDLAKNFFDAGADDCIHFTIKDFQLRAKVRLYLRKRQDFYNLQKQNKLLKTLGVRFENSVVSPDYIQKTFENEINFSKRFEYATAFMALSFDGEEDIFNILKNSTRQNDIIGQVSDNIFYILLPETFIGGAYRVYKKIKALLGENVKLNAGACEYDFKMSFTDLSKKALKALKEASILGNNIVITDKFDDGSLNQPAEKDFKLFNKIFSRKVKYTIEPVFSKAKEIFENKYKTNVNIDYYITETKNYFSLKNVKSNDEAALKVYYEGLSKISLDVIYRKNAFDTHNYVKLEMKELTNESLSKVLDNLSFEFDKMMK